MAVELRRIRVDEWRDLRDIRLRALRDAPDAFGSTYEEEASDREQTWIDRARDGAAGGPSFTVIAQDEGRWIGLAVGAPHRDHPGEAGLFAMWVDPGSRGTGIGRALVEQVVAWAGTAGFPVIRLLVTLSNDEAVRLYTRTGFGDDGGRRPLRTGSEVTTMSMSMDLRV
jgi:GNAT superfamily N-acetyltransferase